MPRPTPAPLPPENAALPFGSSRRLRGAGLMPTLRLSMVCRLAVSEQARQRRRPGSSRSLEGGWGRSSMDPQQGAEGGWKRQILEGGASEGINRWMWRVNPLRHRFCHGLQPRAAAAAEQAQIGGKSMKEGRTQPRLRGRTGARFPLRMGSPVGLRRLRRHLENDLPQGIVVRAWGSPFFPWSYLRRNIEALEREDGWRCLPPRRRRSLCRDLLRVRSRFFLQVRAWRLAIDEHFAADRERDCTLCDHCGACCEIASGLAAFPPLTELPTGWRRRFNEGLGRWHRFCPFLWELEGTGRSRCAIHPWRPLPCRAFGEEECAYLKTGRPPLPSQGTALDPLPCRVGERGAE